MPSTAALVTTSCTPAQQQVIASNYYNSGKTLVQQRLAQDLATVEIVSAEPRQLLQQECSQAGITQGWTTHTHQGMNQNYNGMGDGAGDCGCDGGGAGGGTDGCGGGEGGGGGGEGEGGNDE